MAKTKEEASGILFDLDGTLVETSSAIVFAFNGALDENGLPERQPDEIKRMIGVPLEDMFARFSNGKDVGKLCDSYRGIFSGISARMSRPYPHVLETLELLDDYRLAVATTKNELLVKRLCDALGLTKFFDVVVGGDMVAHTKPAPDMVLLAAERIGLRPSATMMVGDTAMDMLAGKAAGTKTCGVTYGFGRREDLVEAGADVIIDDFGQLLRVV